ncbi:MAG: type II toxin-antitoxin system RelE/ParE family toxin [Planctomycetota bacterium]|nr:MAG: type II toxin-antitoxin system RelE/ParE family toxin [Planctomycetota bacterium]
MKFRVLPAADGEAIAAAIWYEDRRSGLGDEFVTEMRSAFDMIRQNPLNAPKLEYYSGPHEIRRQMLHRFPYAVVYLCRADEIVVVAVAHSRRRPLHWLNRLD